MNDGKDRGVRCRGHRPARTVQMWQSTISNTVLFGAGDISRLAHYSFTRDRDHTVVAFTVDAQYRHGDAFLGLPLVAFDTVVRCFPPDDHMMFVALSYAR